MIAMGLSSLLNPALKIMVFVVIAPVLHWIVAGNLLDIIAMEAFGTALSLITLALIHTHAREQNIHVMITATQWHSFMQ